MADEEQNRKRKDSDDQDQRTSSFSDNSNRAGPSKRPKSDIPQTPVPSPSQDSQALDMAASSASTAIVWSPNVKSDHIIAPWPWATTQRAHVKSLNDLLSSDIRTISGVVFCDLLFVHLQYLDLDLQSEFDKVASVVAANKSTMFHTTPEAWLYPARSCSQCNRVKFVRPFISSKKRFINWLFLLLSQMLVFCSNEQLEYFCKHSNIPHNGERDELLCLTYLGLCKQLDPSGPFDP
ncbi:hypothetical protein HHK36_002462 [Tetracentron sinense]|uniref:DUF7086 domain-containing protein n=1 Tax=Tetracentron sinense TaxID=13715 RepID=A0A834ZRF6_TETSI|nr:hypothetical protein HHK36_002462 [Tetracentron sinense]